jgi:hypothetical protein
VFDLTDEMHQLAADAAATARPMAVAEVMRRGSHRRTRMIAQRSIGGLSAIALGAVVFTGVIHQAGSNPAASGAAGRGDSSVSVTQTTAAGQITLQVKYQVLPTGKLKLLSVAYSGDSKKALTKKNSALTFIFGPGLNSGKNTISAVFIASSHLSGSHHFSGSLSAKTINDVNKNGVLGKNGSVIASLPSGIAWTPTHKANDHAKKKMVRFLTATAIVSQ